VTGARTGFEAATGAVLASEDAASRRRQCCALAGPGKVPPSQTRPLSSMAVLRWSLSTV